MPAQSQDVRVAISRHAAAVRYGDPDDIANAKRDLTAERLADYLARTLAAAPPLSPSQRARLRDILRNGGDRNGGA